MDIANQINWQESKEAKEKEQEARQVMHDKLHLTPIGTHRVAREDMTGAISTFRNYETLRATLTEDEQKSADRHYEKAKSASPETKEYWLAIGWIKSIVAFSQTKKLFGGK